MFTGKLLLKYFSSHLRFKIMVYKFQEYIYNMRSMIACKTKPICYAMRNTNLMGFYLLFLYIVSLHRVCTRVWI